MTDIKRKINQPGMRWLMSYIVIVFAIIAVLLVYSLVIIGQVRKDADSTNRRFASYYNSTLENRLKSIQDYSYTLVMDNTARELQKCSDSESMNSPVMLSEAYNIVYSIRDFIQANGMTDDIMLYYPVSRQIIGKYGSLPAYAYFKATHLTADKQDSEYREWESRLFNNRGNGFKTVINADGRNEIYYYYRAFYRDDDGESVRVVVRLSREKLCMELESLVKSGGYLFAALIDGGGNVFAEAPAGTEYTGGGRYTYEPSARNGVEYVSKSSLWDLSLVTVQDYGSAYNLVRIISYILIVGVLLSLVIGIVISTHYANRGHRAVDRIVRRFEAGGIDMSQNEFDFINGQIDVLLEKNRNAIAASEKQAKIIAYSFLRDLLCRKTCTEKDVEQMCAMYGIEMENEMYELLILSRDDGYTEKPDRETIMNMMAACESENFSVYWTRFSGGFNADVFLCNFDAYTRSPQTAVIEFARNIKKTVGEEVRIILGNVLNSQSEINSEWHLMLHDNFPECEVSQARLNENEGQQAVKEFGEAIDNQNLTEAINMIPHLNRRFISCRNDNLTRCRKYTLIGKLYESTFGDSQHEAIDSLLTDIDDPDWSRRLIAMLRTVDRDINQKTDMRQVAEMAHEIIDQEYSNPQLGLHMIADRIGVSQSYLSRLFKQKYGIGVIRYLNYVRIEQAKKLMVTGSDNLQIIAMNVGFLSDVTLIRVFKKYENTTPGSFRNKD